MKNKGVIVGLFVFLALPLATDAHQPRLVYDYPQSTKEAPIVIEQPEVSRAFYGELKKQSDFYKINLAEDRELYFNILIPDLSHLKFLASDKQTVAAEKVINAPIVKITNNFNKEEIVFGGDGVFTEKFFEEFGGDDYWKGPEIKRNFGKGVYTIEVFSTSAQGKYVLAVGDIEAFTPGEAWNALKSMPDLKTNFFEKSILLSYWNRIGLFLGVGILGLLFVIVVVGVIVRAIYKKNHS